MSGHTVVGGIAKTITDVRLAVSGVAKQVRYIVQDENLLWSLKTMWMDGFNRTLLGSDWVKISANSAASMIPGGNGSVYGGLNPRVRYVRSTSVGGIAQWAEAVVSGLPAGSEAGVVLRSGNGSNATCMFATLTPTGWRVGYIAVGNIDPISWATGTRAFTPGDRIRAEIATSTLLVYVNDQLVHTQTGTSYVGTYIGMRAIENGSIDRWYGGAL
ncbi:hypothetical protein ACT89R_01595 [Rhodococcus qingshengii]